MHPVLAVVPAFTNTLPPLCSHALSNIQGDTGTVYATLSVALEALDFGVFASVLLCAVYSLLSKKPQVPSSKIMLYTATILCFSTSAYWGYRLQQAMAASRYRDAAANDILAQCTGVDSPPGMNVTEAARATLHATHDNVVASAMSLTVNMFVGDAIIVWRACVLWPGNRRILVLGVFLTLVTFALGCAATYQEVRADRLYISHPAIFFVENLCGTASAILSLVTNVGATCLIAYKAREHRLFLKNILSASRRRTTRVLKILLLFVYLGTLYCIFWLAFVIFLLSAQVTGRRFSEKSTGYPEINVTTAETLFGTITDMVLGSVLVPVVAIYPLLMIVLVALDQSHPQHAIETGHIPAEFSLKSVSVSGTLCFAPHVEDVALPMPTRSVEKRVVEGGITHSYDGSRMSRELMSSGRMRCPDSDSDGL